MKRAQVDSHAIQSLGYDPKSRTLEVEFEDGGVYDYRDVPQSLYRDFTAADSKGQFFAAHIRDRFAYQKR